MKIGLQTWGTEGDVRPFFALADELRRSGHAIEMSDFRVSLDCDFRQHLRAIVNITAPLAQTMAGLHRLFEPHRIALEAESQRLCRENDIVVGHPCISSLKAHARRQGIPHFTLTYLPHLATAMEGERGTVIAASRLFHRPADDADRHVCGWFQLPSAEPSAEIRKFLDAGPPPVFMTHGSMALQESVDLLEQAAFLSGRRAIIQYHEPRMSAHRGILFVDRAPHASVFPCCSVVVHHAGAGTAHQAVFSGRPSVTMPFMVDQFYWAAELSRLGVGADPIPFRTATAAAVARGIAQADTDAVRLQASGLAEYMRREDGTMSAKAFIEERLLAGVTP